MRDLGVVSPREWQRVILFAALVMLITTLPYLVGALHSNDEWTFSGFLFGADDGNSYLAKMRLGARGDWLFTIRYTHEPHDGALLFLPYILLGKLAALFAGADSPDLVAAMVVTFHAARVVFGFALLLVSYRVTAVFLLLPETRMTALILIALGGGLGWLLVLLGQDNLFDSLPVDFFIPEGYSFLVLFGLPHIALSRAAMLLGLLLLFRALGVPDRPRAWLRWTLPAGVCWIVMGLCVPFYVPVLYLVLGFWGLATWGRTRRFPWALFWRAVSAAGVALPVLLYSLVVFETNNVMARWSSQNNLPSSHPLHYVFGYIVIGIPAVLALRWAWRRGGRSRNALPYLLLVAWVVVMPLLVYLPINVQRRLAEGVIVPLSILAAAGLRLAFPQRRTWLRARAAVLIPALLTSVLLLLGGTFNAMNRARPLFYDRTDTRALVRLDARAPRDAIVLSTKETGNVLPTYTNLLAYAGHGPETLNARDKIDRVERFFSGELTPGEQRAMLQNVDYVYFGPLERELAETDAPAWFEGLRQIEGFDNPVTIYEVVHED